MLKLFLILASCLSIINAQCPTIVSRSAWGARAPRSSTAMTNPVPFVIIHHGESGECSTRDSCAAIVRSYQNFHMDSNGWSDIGYSFIVGGDGSVFEGRGWSKVGAHAPNYNSNSIGICFIGSFGSKNPTTAAQNAAKNLISCGVSTGKIRSTYTLKGHRDVTATSCPGNSLYALIKTWPRYG